MTYVNNLAAAMTGTPDWKEKQARGLAALQISVNRTDLSFAKSHLAHLTIIKQDDSSVTYLAPRDAYSLCEGIRSLIAHNNWNLIAVPDGHNWVKVSVKEA